MRIAAHTLGCKLNSAETSTILEQFRVRGWQLSSTADSDVFLLNTCSVTANAERECRQVVRRVLRENPHAFIAVTGCYAQLRPEEIASIDGVDVVLGAKEKFSIFDHIAHFIKYDAPRIFSSPIEEALEYHLAATAGKEERSRAFLKIQDGCDYTCSYCTIPKARGASRSAEIEQVLTEAIRLSQDGFKEIVLSGVNVGDFGTKTGTSFYALLCAIEAEKKVTSRVRISSIEPNLLTDEIIGLVAKSDKFCPHFHIPLQSGSGRILRSMQRRYTKEIYRSRIESINKMIPNAGIGVDVIVGFPGETEEEFRECYEFIHSLEVSYLHVFTYSERPDTKAAQLGKSVSKDSRKIRNEMLRILSQKKKQEFYRTQLGATGIALLEHSSDGKQRGFTENYVRVELKEPIDHAAELVRVRYDECSGDSVSASVVEVLTYDESSILLPIVS